MAITPLSVQQIVSVIRQQMVESVRPQGTNASLAPSGSAKKSNGRPTRSARSKDDGLSNLIGHRVGALDANDPDRARKAFRIFLESVLLNELGEQLINDPAFYQLVDDIHSQMESTPGIAQAMQDAAAQLLAGATPGPRS